MNDDQVVTLLRDTPLPADPPDRYAAVTARGRRSDKRRTTVLAVVVTVVAVAGTASALTWRGTAKAGPESFLSTTEDAGTAHVAISSSGPEALSGSGVIDFVHSRVRLDMTVGGQPLKLIQIGRDSWLGGSGAAMAGFGDGKLWMHVLESGQQSADLARFNPAKVLTTLRDEHATFATQGHEQVGGIDTTDYLVSGKGEAIDALLQGGRGHVFVDSTGLVRRIASTQNGAVVQMDFSDFGAPVDIQAPPAAQTTEEPDLSSSLGGVSTLTPGKPTHMTAAQRAQLCATVTAQVAHDGRITEAQKAQMLRLFCGK